MAYVPSRSISVCAADLFSLAKALFYRRRSPAEFLPKQGRSFYPELLCRLSSAPRRRLLLDLSSRVSILSTFANIPQRHPQWFRAESFPDAVGILDGFSSLCRSLSPEAYSRQMFFPCSVHGLKIGLISHAFQHIPESQGISCILMISMVFHRQQGQRRVPPFVLIRAWYLCSTPF